MGLPLLEALKIHVGTMILGPAQRGQRSHSFTLLKYSFAFARQQTRNILCQRSVALHCPKACKPGATRREKRDTCQRLCRLPYSSEADLSSKGPKEKTLNEVIDNLSGNSNVHSFHRVFQANLGASLIMASC
jgi:hypothetical protein